MAESGLVQNVPHPEMAQMRVVANAIKVNGERGELTAAPALGEHDAELLASRGAKVRE